MPDSRQISIPRRFCGPPNSANGGYACGRLATFVDGAAEVTLRSPPPLDKTLTVVDEDDGVALYDGTALVAMARHTTVDVPVPPVPGLQQAREAAARTIPPERHELPTCFVCGPLREPHDGLHIHVGPLEPDGRNWGGPVAAPWSPAVDLAGDDGLVFAEFVWAALDCPTGYAAGFGGGEAHLLLGRQSVRILRRPAAGEQCIVVARQTGRDGRKHFAEGVLFGADAEAIALCKAVWIAVPPTVQRGDP